MTPAPQWLVVHTHPQAEERAAAHLERQGYCTYLPRYLKKRCHARRTQMVPAPLFPRYLFVGADIELQRWRSIRSTVGVAKLMAWGEEPATVPDGVVRELRAREADGFVVFHRVEMKPGTPIRLVNGAFASYLGLFEGMRDSDRVSVLLDMLGRRVRVVVDADAVVAA
jgi:transcriptional antiterminator RfaH